MAWSVSSNPVDAAPAPQAQPNFTPPVGPTGFWSRIQHVGASAVNALEAPGKAIGGKIYAPLAKAQNASADQDVSNVKLAVKTANTPGIKPNAKLPTGSTLPSEMAQNTKDIKQATDVGQMARNAGKAIVQAPINLKNKAVANFKDTRTTGISPDEIIKNSQTIQQKMKDGSLDPETTKVLSGKFNPNIRAKAEQMALKGTPAKDIQSFIESNTQREKSAAKSTAGDVLGTAALVAGGGEAADVIKGGKVALTTLAANAGIGAAGNVGSNLSSKPDASLKELMGSAKSGAEFGAVSTLLEGVGGKVLEDVKTILGKNQVVNTAIKTAASNALLKKAASENSKIPIKDASEAVVGKVGTNSFPEKVDVKPSQKNVPFTDTEFRQQFKGSANNAAKVASTANSYLKTGSKDSLTLVVNNLADATNSKTVGATVDKLVPDLATKDRTDLVKAVTAAKDTKTVKQLLFDAAKNNEHGMEVIHPETTISFDDYKSHLNALGEGYKRDLESGADKATLTKKYGNAIQDLNEHFENGTKPGKAITEATQKMPSVATEVESSKTPSLTQDIKRPAGEKTASEPLVNNNKPASKGLGAAIQSKGSGTFNPELAAARKGNTEFASAIRKISSGDALANAHANQAADKFSGLFDKYVKSGGTKEDFVKDVESGKLGSDAHQFWVDHYKQMGSALEGAGVLKNGARDSSYVPRIAKFGDKNPTGVGGLKKTGGFAKGRIQEAAGELGQPGNDLYKTHGEFKAAVEKGGGKVMDNPVDIMRSSTAQRLKALNHSEGLDTLDKTAMRDGRAATITFDQSKGLPAGYGDYNTSLVPGRAVHPEAVQGIKALVKPLSDNETIKLLAKTNSVAKRLVTLNGLVHAKNFTLASIRESGLRGTAAAFKQYGEEDVNRAIEHGFVPSRAGVTNVFDAANDGKGALGHATSLLGKADSKMQKTLFEGFGDKLGMSTYLHVEKNLIKQGLDKDEAGKIAGDAANRVIFSQRSTEASPALREASRVAFFAGKFFQSTMAIGTKATGLAKNNALSDIAQKAEQKQAAKAVARGFTYLFAAAQAINYATTGHSTFQNKDSKISPVFHVDKTTGKEYHITNFYGQLGELLNLANPKTVINKASPVLQQGARLLTNRDPYKGTDIRDTSASGPRQLIQMFANTLENMVTPLGFQTSGLGKVFGKGGDPGSVTGAKLLGYGTSTTDQNTLEKDISKRYYATLPAGTGPAKSQQLVTLEAAARNDLSKGKTSSSNVEAVKKELSPTAFTKFMKTGADTQVQSYFDGLPNDQKLEIVDKYSPKQLKELDTTGLVKSLVGSSAKTTIESLQTKGYPPEKINSLLQKLGYGQSQLQQIKQAAKVQASEESRKSRNQPKFVNPLLK